MPAKNRPTFLLLAVLSSAGAVALGLPAQAGFDEQVSLAADALVVRNLIGETRVVGHDGPSFEIEIRVQGKDATPERVRVETVEGPSGRVEVHFPLGESRRYVYPALGHGRVSVGADDSGFLSRILGRDMVEVSSGGSGLEIWADLTVRVPRSKRVEIRQAVGDVAASGLEAEVDLDTSSGTVEVRDVKGSVSIDTGSGDVTVEGVEGDLSADTGSGGVEVVGVHGDVSIDTGSGRVEVHDATTRVFHVDTGSGGVVAEGVGADELGIDTGSGSVKLDLTRVGGGRFDIDTGSGSITLRVPPGISARFHAETGSGGIEVDLDGKTIHATSKDELLFSIGGGAADVALSTGSGSIRIAH
jgi:hypothetical protein